MVIGIWSGASKPSLKEYLAPLIEELKTLLANGACCNSHHVCIRIGHIIADTPARAFLKGNANMNYDHNPFTIDSYNQSMKIIQGTVLFNHKSGCQQCTTVGEYNREFRNVSFPNIDAKRRTNEEFRNRVQPSHHKEDSPFEELGIDMIRAFPTSDPLHLLELGVMRRCLYRWVFG